MEKQDILEPDCFYHIFNRGNNKENIFLEEDNYFHFLKLIKNHLLVIAEIYAYCLLKNHFHLTIKIKSKEELEKNNLEIEKLHQPFSNLLKRHEVINLFSDRENLIFQHNETFRKGNYEDFD